MIGARSRSGSKSDRLEDSFNKALSSSDMPDVPGNMAHLHATPMSRDGSASSRASTNTFGPSSNIHSYHYRNHMDSLSTGIETPGSNYASARASPIGPPPIAALPSLPDDIGMAYNTRPVTALYDGLPTLSDVNERHAPASSTTPRHPFAYPSPDPDDGEPQASEERFYTARSDASSRRTAQSGQIERRRPAASSPPSANSPHQVHNNSGYSARHPPPAMGLPPLPNGHRPSGSNTTDTSAEDALSALGYMHGSVEEYPQKSAGSSKTLQNAPNGSYSQADSSRESRDRTQSQATTIGTTTETATSSSAGMPSKSVLTVALQKAQSAVLLDSAGNEQAAIQAYEQSIRLLRQVMQRVEESAGNWRAREMEKLDQLRERRKERRRSARANGGGDSFEDTMASHHVDQADEETADERRERERREQKLLKREKMRLDESRRLKVIVSKDPGEGHDTYEERIRVLTIDLEERNRIDQLSKEALERELALEAAQQKSYKFPNARPPNTPPNNSTEGERRSKASDHTRHSSIARQSALPFPNSPQSRSSDAQNVVEQTPPPTIPVPHITPINLGSTFADMPDFASSPAIEAEREKVKRRSLGPADTSTSRNKSILSFSPDSDDMHQIDKFANQMSEPRKALGEAHAIMPGHAKKSSASSVSSTPSSASGSAAVFAGSSAAKHAGSPNDRRRLQVGKSHHATDEEEEIGSPYHPSGIQAFAKSRSKQDPESLDSHTEHLTTPKLGSATINGFQATHSRHSSTASPPDNGRSRASSQASSANHTAHLRHITSQDSLSSAASGSTFSATGPWLAQPGNQMPMPPGLDHAQRSAGPPLVPLHSQTQAASSTSILGRQGRSASLAQTASVPAANSLNDKNLLVNPSTAHGTISRRRRSPNPSEDYTSTSRTARSRPDLPRSVSTESKEDLHSISAISNTAARSQAENSTSTTRHRAVSQPASHARSSSQHNKATPPLPSSAFTSNTTVSRDEEIAMRNPPKIEPAIHYLQKIDEANSISPTAVAAAYAQEGYQDRRKEYAAAGYDASGSFLEPETPASTSFSSNIQPPQLDTVDMTSLDHQRQGYVAPPRSQIRLPYHFMRQLQQSIQTGEYITPRLYVPKQMWTQSGIKLLHLETKIRVIDLLLAGLDNLEKAGEPLLSTNPVLPVAARSTASEKLIRELDNFESLLEEAQSTLSKKLGFAEVSGSKKAGQNSFSTWGSKLSRSMDKMTKTKNLDAPETYVAAISRLCVHVQVLDRHICSLQAESETAESASSRARSGTINASQSPKAPSAYSDLHQDVRRQIESRLRRSSDFFAKVFAKVVLGDLNIWLDKYSKRAAGWTVD